MKDLYPELFPSGKFSRMKILLGGDSCNNLIFLILLLINLRVFIYADM